jgi:hypothetical protein
MPAMRIMGNSRFYYIPHDNNHDNPKCGEKSIRPNQSIILVDEPGSVSFWRGYEMINPI